MVGDGNGSKGDGRVGKVLGEIQDGLEATPKSDEAELPEGVCPECEGRGWLVEDDGGAGRARQCACQEAERIPRLLERSGIPLRYSAKNLVNFNVQHGEPVEQQQRRQALSISRQYVDSFLDADGRFCESGLLFFGAPGVGKTHLAVAILKDLIRRYGLRGRFVDFTELVHRIQSTFNPSSPESKHQVLDPVIDAELLVLDELGAQKPSEWVRETLYLIVNARYTRRLPTLFTTNYQLSPEKRTGSGELGASESRPRREHLAERIGARLVSRLWEMAQPVEIRTKDFREDVNRVRASSI